MAPRTCTSPPVIAAATRSVPASIRSGMTECSTPVSRDTPSIVMMSVPAPWIRAPMRDQRPGEILDLRLAGGVLQHRRPLGEHRGHQHVLGAGDGDLVEAHRRAPEPRGAGLDVAVLDVDVRPQRRASPSGAGRWAGRRWRSRRAGRPGPVPEAAEQRPEHQHRGAHRPDQVVRAPPGAMPGRGSHRTRAGPWRSVPGPRSASTPIVRSSSQHGGDVRQVGDIAEGRRTLAEQGRGHQGERGVLAARHAHLALQPGAAFDVDLVQGLRLLDAWSPGRGGVSRGPADHVGRGRVRCGRSHSRPARARTGPPAPARRRSPARAARPGRASRGARRRCAGPDVQPVVAPVERAAAARAAHLGGEGGDLRGARRADWRPPRRRAARPPTGA